MSYPGDLVSPRRYRRFRELHTHMQHKYGNAAKVADLKAFPPRRLFGNFSERVVAERRAQLEVREGLAFPGVYNFLSRKSFQSI